MTTRANGVLPSFLIIGAQKSGTTSLHSYLTLHPCICGPERKEVHFFDVNWRKGIRWYRSHFPKVEELGTEGITGEATPEYLFYPAIPERVFRAIPDVRLIVLLRNPVDRAYSHYQHAVRGIGGVGRESVSFEEAVTLARRSLIGSGGELLPDPDRDSFDGGYRSYLARGIYVRQLERWFRYFDRDRFLVLDSQELFDKPEETTQRTVAWLGLEPQTLGPLAAHNAGGPYPVLDGAIRKELNAFFKPYNEALFTLLGRTFDW